jgi:hypothetical protein
MGGLLDHGFAVLDHFVMRLGISRLSVSVLKSMYSANVLSSALVTVSGLMPHSQLASEPLDMMTSLSRLDGA